MRILHIISSGGMYGAESVILNLSRGLAEQGHQSIVGVFDNSAESNLQLAEAAARTGIEVHQIRCRGQIDRSVVTSIRKLAATTRADVLHAHGYKADIYTFMAMRRAGAGLVSTCHNWLDSDWKVKLYGALDRQVLRGYDRVVGVSEPVRQRLLEAGVQSERICAIGNGIDVRPFETAKAVLREELGCREELIVGFVGRLSREKGADIYLRAAAVVLERRSSTHFVLAGDGPDRAMLEGLAKELGIEAKVTLLGRRTDVPSIYASLDLLVSSSRMEGLPMAILEGMASGCALVATAVGEVPRVVSDGVTGRLVPAEDVVSLAEAILEMLGDAGRRRQMGVAAREVVARDFSAAAMTASYIELYKRACSDRAKLGLRHGEAT